MTIPDRPPASRPAPLRWLYVLITVALVSVGAAAGNLFFYGVPSLAVPWNVRRVRCEAMYGTRSSSGSLGELEACMGDQDRIRGLVLLAAVGVLLFGALLLALAIPLRDQRLLRRYGRRDEPAAQERFAELCRSHGLSGRGVPRLWVAGPAVRHTFTTAVPGRRATIVIPARVALRTNEEFDAIVSHELAHVLARDVTWVSVVRGPQWLFVPVVAAASLPLFNLEGVSLAPATTLIEVLLLVVAVAILAAALLRMREHEADRFAADTGAELGLTQLLGRAPAPRRSGPLALLRRMVARHPDPAERILALRSTDRAFEGGFAQALAVGFVAMMAMGTATTLLATLNRTWWGWQGNVISPAVGVAVLSTLFPSLFRRARLHGDRPQWWRAVLGVAVGIALGAFISPVVSVTGKIPYPELIGNDIGPRVVAVALVAVLVAGAVAIAISLAVLSAGTAKRAFAGLAMVSAYLTGLAALWPVMIVVNILFDTPFDVRTWLAYILVRNVWPALGLAAVLIYVLLLAISRSDRDRQTPWLVATIATIVGGGAAILNASAVTASDMNDRLRVQQERWWICAAAGVVVLVVVALGQRGRYGWPNAVVAAAATTGVSSAAHYLYAYLADRPAEPAASWSDPPTALVWLFYLTVLLAPFLAVHTASRSTRRWALPPVPAAAGTAALTVLVAVAVSALGVPGGFATESLEKESAPEDPYAALRHAITKDQAETIAAAGVLVVPNDWTLGETGEVGGGVIASNAPMDDTACRPLVREGFMSVAEDHLRATGKRVFGSRRTAGDLESSALSITVYSYDTGVSERLIDAAEDARVACPRFTILGEQVSIDFSINSGTPPGLGEWSWRYDSTLRSVVNGREITGTNAYVILAAGNTVIVVYLSSLTKPLDEVLLRRVLDNAMYTLTHLP